MDRMGRGSPRATYCQLCLYSHLMLWMNCGRYNCKWFPLRPICVYRCASNSATAATTDVVIRRNSSDMSPTTVVDSRYWADARGSKKLKQSVQSSWCRDCKEHKHDSTCIELVFRLIKGGRGVGASSIASCFSFVPQDKQLETSTSCDVKF